MISLPLFKRNMITAARPLLIFMLVLAMYGVIIIWMFDPSLADMLNQYQDMMPDVMSAFGMTGDTSSLIAFMNTYLYGFLLLIIPMIFEVIIINSFVTKYVDSGSLACILATPNTRKKVIFTQVLSILINVLVLITVNALIGYISAEFMFQGELDIKKYILLNISTLLLHFAISGIAFFAACYCNDTKGYMSFGVGLPVAFYLIQMLSNMGSSLENLKYFTLYTLFPSEKIVAGESGVLFYNCILFVIAAVLFTCGSIRFIKKDLPI